MLQMSAAGPGWGLRTTNKVINKVMINHVTPEQLKIKPKLNRIPSYFFGPLLCRSTESWPGGHRRCLHLAAADELNP